MMPSSIPKLTFSFFSFSLFAFHFSPFHFFRSFHLLLFFTFLFEVSMPYPSRLCLFFPLPILPFAFSFLSLVVSLFISFSLHPQNTDIFSCLFQERTKNAQFIIISLRNNMFELADRLVGIYKTNNCTKSVVINPELLVAS